MTPLKDNKVSILNLVTCLKLFPRQVLNRRNKLNMVRFLTALTTRFLDFDALTQSPYPWLTTPTWLTKHPR